MPALLSAEKVIINVREGFMKAYTKRKGRLESPLLY